MAGVLLDSHTLYWLVSGAPLADDALISIGEAQAAGNLMVSPITAWELAVATQKRDESKRPHLGEDTPTRWFREAIQAAGATTAPIRQRIALEAAAVALTTGHRDPADCFIMATARARGLTLVTRDDKIIRIAADTPGYLSVVEC